MPIENGDFIRLSYTGTVAGTIFDTTDEDQARDAGIHNPQGGYGPVTIHVGSHHVIVGLDEALPGKEVGYEGEIDVPPEKAFGEHDANKVEAYNKNSFKDKPRKGGHVKIDDKGDGTVVDVIGNRVLVDFNHPFAGKTLHYSFKIEENVDAPEEQFQGLIKLYAGREMDLKIEDGKATIDLPPGINYDRRWVLWRSRIIHEAFEYIKDVNEIVLVETFHRPEEKSPDEEPEQAE